MYQTQINTTAAEPVPAAAALFTPLEQTVLDLARGERGKGLRPTGRLGIALERISSRLFGRQAVRPLADPRLEALRTFVNALHRCNRKRIDATAELLRSAGFDLLQESWIRSTHLRCA